MQLLNIFHVLIAIAMIALILVQRGAGATAGAAFGSGASGTVFGASGAGNFLTRSTSVAAILFFVISMSMAVMASNMSKTLPEEDLGVVANDSVIQQVEENLQMPEETTTAAPVSDLPAAIETEVQQMGGQLTDDMPGVDEALQAVEENAEEMAVEGETPQ
ncbi:MAG: preprotein translocase subunit SecG [Proteobacteria bacterium]|nr:preprotein translocase subunit SecG [Pseudomonadota bacterium]